jgi:hypothetical protein
MTRETSSRIGCEYPVLLRFYVQYKCSQATTKKAINSSSQVNSNSLYIFIERLMGDVMFSELKTISHIEAETIKEEKSYDQTELSRMIALVVFLREVESQYGCNFKIVFAYPQITENAHWLNGNQREKYFTLGTWARISIKGVEHMVDTKNISFSDKAYDTSPETVREIVEDLRGMFADILAL